MQDELGDAIGDVLGEILGSFADEIGFRPIRLGYQFIRFVATSGRGDQRSSKQEGPGETLNRLIQGRQFEAAKKVLHGLDLPYSTHREVLQEIERIERESERTRLWELAINEFLRQGEAEAAIRFIEGLDLSYEQKTHAVEAIQAARGQLEERRRQIEKRQRQVQEWNDHLNGLLRSGAVRQAKSYVKSLPIEKGAKKAILAQL